nr:hypothetical protein [Clostridiales bacterium]
MKKNLLCFVLTAVMILSFVGCSGETISSSLHLEDYVFTVRYHDDFNVLQLSDIHWNVNSSTKSSTAYLDKLFKEVNDHIVAAQGASAKIDLVELTGDTFMLANTYHL